MKQKRRTARNRTTSVITRQILRPPSRWLDTLKSTPSLPLAGQLEPSCNPALEPFLPFSYSGGRTNYKGWADSALLQRPTAEGRGISRVLRALPSPGSPVILEHPLSLSGLMPRRSPAASRATHTTTPKDSHSVPGPRPLTCRNRPCRRC